MRSTGVVTEAVWVLTLAISKLQTKRGRGTNRLGGSSQGGGGREGGREGRRGWRRESQHERAGVRSVGEWEGEERGGRERKKGKMRVKGGTCYVLKKRNNKRVFHDSMVKTLLRL